MIKSKYHPFYRKLGEDWIEACLSRLEGSVLFFALGLLVGFCFHPACVWGAIGIWLLVGCGIFYTHLKRAFFLLIIGSFLLGTMVAQVRFKYMDHPTLSAPIFQITLKGKVENNVILPDKQILTISDIDGPRPDSNLPHKIQLNFFATEPVLHAGDMITFQASLFPLRSSIDLFGLKTPSPQFFKGIGAFGVLTQLKEQRAGNLPPSFFEKIRQNLAAHLLKILPENQARIAIPLITGEQRFVSKEQYHLYRQVGITHVLSVSGFHMALLAGFLFFLIRGLCALMMGLSLRFNSKKIAAVLAWIGVLLYLILSGAQVPALRSFGMISLVFLGILTDRVAFSKRSLFLVAAMLLICQPENILSISFQLSFLSVLVLIATHEWLKEKMKDKSRFVRGLSEFFLLNLMITFALMPLIAGYFHLINPYAVLGNLVFSLLFSFVIMPGLFIGCVLWPIGVGDTFFKLAGYFLQQVEKVSSKIAALPFTEITVSSFDMSVIALFSFGLVFFCTFKRIGKTLAVVLWSGAVILLFKTSYPQVLFYDESMVWAKEGTLYQNEQGQNWIQSRWQQALGFSEVITKPKPDTLSIKGHKIALTGGACVGAKVALLSYADVRCHAPKIILKPATMYQVFITPDKIQIQEGAKVIQTIKP